MWGFFWDFCWGMVEGLWGWSFLYRYFYVGMFKMLKIFNDSPIKKEQLLIIDSIDKLFSWFLNKCNNNHDPKNRPKKINSKKIKVIK